GPAALARVAGWDGSGQQRAGHVHSPPARQTGRRYWSEAAPHRAGRRLRPACAQARSGNVSVEVPPSATQELTERRRANAAGGGRMTRILDSARSVLHGSKMPAGSPFAVLRRRLIFTNLAVAAIVFIALSTGVYAYVAHTDLTQIDQILVDQATHQAHDELSL